MGGSLSKASIFLINTIFGLYLALLSIRLILAWERANYFNPVTRFIITLTQPIINPLRRIFHNIGSFEVSTFLFILLLEGVKLGLITWVGGFAMNVAILAYSILTETVQLILATFFFAIFVDVILSWINPHNMPLRQVVGQIAAPIMRPLRKLIPTISGFDISPLIALILIQFLMILI